MFIEVTLSANNSANGNEVPTRIACDVWDVRQIEEAVPSGDGRNRPIGSFIVTRGGMRYAITEPYEHVLRELNELRRAGRPEGTRE